MLKIIPVFFLIACSSVIEPKHDLRGDYDLSVGNARGVVSITYFSADSIAGVVSSAELSPAMRLGFLNGSAYVVNFALRAGGSVTLRLRSSDLSCERGIILPASVDVQCSVVRR